ncbi:MAG: YfhO family protein [Anaerolineales bacterium]
MPLLRPTPPANKPMAQTFFKRIKRIDIGLAVLLLGLSLFNGIYFKRSITTVHDTYANFQNFYIFYNQYFYNHDLAHWYPYGTMGLQADYQQIISLTPASYLTGLVGGILRVRDVLLLFKLALYVDQIMLLLGIYLLSRHIFQNRSTAYLVSLAVVGSSVWYAQVWFNFRIYYLLPLVLYFLVSFFSDHKPKHFWLAGITAVAWGIGNVPYFLPLWGMILLIVVVFLTLKNPKAWRTLISASTANVVGCATLILLAGAYLYFTLHALNHTALRAPGRDPATGEVTLEIFRTYGGTANLLTVFQSSLTGWPLELPWGSTADNSVYIGLLPFLLFGWALFKEKDRFFRGTASSTLCLIWLSVGGLFTTALYYVPLMRNYRHVGLVYGLVKILIAIAAGFGLDRILVQRDKNPPGQLLLMITFAFVIESLFAAPGFISGIMDLDEQAVWHGIFQARLLVYLALIVLTLAFKKHLQIALTLALLFDLLTFQLLVYYIKNPQVPDPYQYLLDTVQVSEIQYQELRRPRPSIPSDAERKQDALDLTEQPGAMAIYWETYDFAQFDPCSTKYRADFWSLWVDRLETLRTDQPVTFSNVTGCNLPKLRLVPNATIHESTEEAESILKTMPISEQGSMVVIRPINKSVKPAEAEQLVEPSGSVAVSKFTLNQVIVNADVTTEGGAWLVYADAYHPGWKATVNGEKAPIEEANLAFKGVWLPEGQNLVIFEFRNGLNYYLSYLIALTGVACTLFGLGLFFSQLLGFHKETAPLKGAQVS